MKTSFPPVVLVCNDRPVPRTHNAPAYQISTQSGNPRLSYWQFRRFFLLLGEKRINSSSELNGQNYIKFGQDIGQSSALPKNVLFDIYFVLKTKLVEGDWGVFHPL